MQDIQLDSNKADITLRFSLFPVFRDTVHKEMGNVGCKYFAHQFIRNYGQEGHTVSSFCTNPDWQEVYWKNYWHCDPLEKGSHKIAEYNGSAITPWNMLDPTSDVMNQRKSACGLNSGVSFRQQHGDGTWETFSFGWEAYNVEQVTREKLLKLSHAIDRFVDAHRKLYGFTGRASASH